MPTGDIRISNQFLITYALHFAQLALETFKLYSATQCDSDACLITRLWLCKMESTSNQKLVANSNIAAHICHWKSDWQIVYRINRGREIQYRWSLRDGMEMSANNIRWSTCLQDCGKAPPEGAAAPLTLWDFLKTNIKSCNSVKRS